MDVFKAFFLLIYAHMWTVALCLLNTGYISIFVSHTFKPILKAWETLAHRPELLCKKGVLRDFTKFAGKYLCQSLFFNKVAGLSLKKSFWHRRFPVNFFLPCIT